MTTVERLNTTSRPRPRSGTRQAARWRTSSSALARAARSAALQYLKERNPTLKVWGIDTYGSVFKKYKETGIFDKNEIHPHITEGIGDFLPGNVNFDIIDHFEKVTDKDGADDAAAGARGRHLGRQPAGAAMAGVVQLAEHFKKG